MPRQQRWTFLLAAAAVFALAVAMGVDDLREGIAVGVLGGLGMLVLALWSGRRGRHIPWQRAAQQIAPGHAVVLWKPGCVYCEQLLLRLRDDPRVTWVNVCRDEAPNAWESAAHGGRERRPDSLIG